MKPKHLITITLCLLAGFVINAGAQSPQNAAPGYTLSGPYTHGNLTVFLVHGKEQTSKTFLTLQEALAQKMRAAWTAFAEKGSPSTAAVPWPSFNAGPNVLSLRSPQPLVESSFDADHHCAFWGVG